MADTKISALTASTTPLAGTEVLPIVQGGVTKQVSVANLTADRAVSASQMTLTAGNLVIGTSGRGIDFSATPGTGTSELLADYEEGTWTPVLAPSSGSITIASPTNSMTYTKVGRSVTVSGFVNVSSVLSPSGDLTLNGLPFSSNSNSACYIYAFGILNTSAHTAIQGAVVSGNASIIIRGYNSGTSVTTFANNIQGGSGLYLFATYFV